MFDHRLAALLGRSVAEMKLTLSQREYESWQLYWDEEPWGPWRDNVHAAIIAREVLRPQLKKGAAVGLDEFMWMSPVKREQARAVRQRQANRSLINSLKAMATKRG